jgi:predicted enzyme related to lactoylglutathione lyase
MGSPVVHFEIHARDSGETQKFYADLFGWKIDSNNPMNYGMVDTQADGHGIAGGIASGSNENMLTFYVAVPDLQATLDRAVAMGSTVVMPVTEMPMVTLAMFTDPAGNKVGIVKG